MNQLLGARWKKRVVTALLCICLAISTCGTLATGAAALSLPKTLPTLPTTLPNTLPVIPSPITVIPAPAAPTNLIATINQAQYPAVILNWQENDSSAAQFKVERKTPGSSYAEIGSVTASSKSYVDQQATPGATYTYRVMAYNGLRFSGYSNEATVVVPMPTINTLIPSGTLLKLSSCVAVDGSGNIYVVDTYNLMNSVVDIMDKNGHIFNTLGSGFSCPQGIAVDSSGNIYVADTGNRAVKKMNAKGIITNTLGSGFELPGGIAVDSGGNVYAVDAEKNDVKRMDATLSLQNITTLASGFKVPTGIVVDGSGNIYVADSDNNDVKRMDANGHNITTLGSGFSHPCDVAVDGSGNIYVADTDNHAVKKMDASGHNITTLGSGFKAPTGIAVDSGGNIYVMDVGNDTVIKISVPGTTGSVTPMEQLLPLTGNTGSASTLQLTATGGNQSVTLNWTAPSYGKTVAGYYPYRGTSAGGESTGPLTNAPVTGSTYTDLNVQNGTTYYYILKPVFSDSSQGTASNEASATPGVPASNSTNSTITTIVLTVGSSTATVNGTQQIDLGAASEIHDSRVFLPIAPIVVALGGNASWDPAQEQVTLTLGANTIDLWIDRSTAQVNGATVPIDPNNPDMAPYISNGHAMLPLRFITENLGCQVTWDNSNQSITITYTKSSKTSW